MKPIKSLCVALLGISINAFADGSTSVTGVLSETPNGQIQLQEIQDSANCQSLAQAKNDPYCLMYVDGKEKVENVVVNLSSGCARGRVYGQLEDAAGALVRLHGSFIIGLENGSGSLQFDARSIDVISK